jgi:hypothetical protein
LSEKRVVPNADKKLLENAPGLDNWPNMADSTWGTTFINTMAIPLTGKKCPATAVNYRTKPPGPNPTKAARTKKIGGKVQKNLSAMKGET